MGGTTRRLVLADCRVHRSGRSATGTRGPRYRGMLLWSILNVCNFVCTARVLGHVASAVSPTPTTMHNAVSVKSIHNFKSILHMNLQRKSKTGSETLCAGIKHEIQWISMYLTTRIHSQEWCCKGTTQWWYVDNCSLLAFKHLRQNNSRHLQVTNHFCSRPVLYFLQENVWW